MHPIREYGGEIFTDYYFGEANTTNKSDNYHNNAINENLNWGRIPGCYTIQVVEDLKTLSTHHIPSPPGPINGDAITSIVEEKTPMNIEAFKQVSLNDITTTLLHS